MNIQSVNDKAFEVYGRVVDGYDYAELLATLEKCSEKPADSVIYVPGCAELEATPAYKDLQINCYGGMPIQIGYCNGTNTKLNCFEYHRDSEIDIAADDVILLVARQRIYRMARLIHPRQKLSYVQRELLLSSTQRPYIMRHAVPSLVKVSVLLSYSLRAQTKISLL